MSIGYGAENRRRPSSGRENKGRLRNFLVMAEVALALILLISAGLLIQSFARLGHVNSGCAPTFC